jgi:hypothetical protein
VGVYACIGGGGVEKTLKIESMEKIHLMDRK